ncbi:hypothetical protein [Aeromonas caviae]|uniref:hypothetical protein n=1 Tax=Aeromonas caviae TaxID=648 RepID=UPI000AA82879
MRYLISLAVSCVVVFFLFLGMNKLITPDHRELTEREDVTMTDFIRLKPQETLQEKQRELPKPPPPKRPPPPPEMEVASTDRPKMDSSPMDMPKLDIPVNIGGGNALGAYSTGGGGGGMGGNNGAIPMATFEPLPVSGNEQAHHAGSPGADGAGGRHHDRLHPPQASGDLARETTGTAQTAAPETPASPARDGGGEHGQA